MVLVRVRPAVGRRRLAALLGTSLVLAVALRLGCVFAVPNQLPRWEVPDASLQTHRDRELRQGRPRPLCRAALADLPAHDDSEAKELKTGIATFYDGLTPLWMDVWGEHLHHGYYGPRPSGAKPEFSGKGGLEEHKAAQVAMIEEALAWGREKEDPPPRRIVDVGCGVGGAARHLAVTFPNSTATGITLSPVQVKKAGMLTAAEGLDGRVHFRVQDALAMPANWTDQHDLVWSLESGEHMPDKERFVSELARITAPGGRVIVVTWVHRDLGPQEQRLRRWEHLLLRLINSCYYLPEWSSAADYERLCKAAGLEAVRRDDWTDAIAPFWPAVIKSAIRPWNFFRLIRTGLDGVRSAVAMVLMVLGYRVGLIKFGLITARKPLTTSPKAPVLAAASLLGQKQGAVEVLPGGARRSRWAKVLYKFSRPHTVNGTIIAAFAAVVRAVQTAPVLSVGLGAMVGKVSGLVLSLLCANMVCVGLNQIYDVQVDRINKPFLPIAAGELGMRRAWGVVVGALVVGVGLACTLFSPQLAFMYTAGMVLGSLYSVPPFRLRRWPLAAAFIISCVRGCMLNFWVYYAVKEILLLPFQWDPVVLFLTRFMTVFTAMIAVTKDLADIKGDRQGKIKTFAATYGLGKSATAATCTLASIYVLAIAEGLWRGGKVFSLPAMVGGHLIGLVYLLWSRSRLDRTPKEGADRFYMRIWDLFYLEYIIYLFL